jgi:hypothetical protein
VFPRLCREGKILVHYPNVREKKERRKLPSRVLVSEEFWEDLGDG